MSVYAKIIDAGERRDPKTKKELVEFCENHPSKVQILGLNLPGKGNFWGRLINAPNGTFEIESPEGVKRAWRCMIEKKGREIKAV